MKTQLFNSPLMTSDRDDCVYVGHHIVGLLDLLYLFQWLRMVLFSFEWFLDGFWWFDDGFWMVLMLFEWFWIV